MQILSNLLKPRCIVAFSIEEKSVPEKILSSRSPAGGESLSNAPTQLRSLARTHERNETDFPVTLPLTSDIYIYIYTVFHLNKNDQTKIRTSLVQATSAAEQDSHKRSYKPPPQRNGVVQALFKHASHNPPYSPSYKLSHKGCEQGSRKAGLRSDRTSLGQLTMR